MWKSILKFVLGVLMSKESSFTIGKIVSSVGRSKFPDWETHQEAPFIKGLQDDNK